MPQMSTLRLAFFELFRLWVLVGVKTTVSDGATDTFATGKDRRCCGPPHSRHLYGLKSVAWTHSSLEKRRTVRRDLAR